LQTHLYQHQFVTYSLIRLKPFPYLREIVLTKKKSPQIALTKDKKTHINNFNTYLRIGQKNLTFNSIHFCFYPIYSKFILLKILSI